MRPKALVRLLAGLLAALPSSVSAAPRAGDVHFFRPALYSNGIFSTDRAETPAKWSPSFKFFFNYEAAPLRLTFPQVAGCPAGKCLGTQDIISRAEVFHLQAQFGITRWLELALEVPISVHSLATNPAADVDEGFELLTVSDPKSNISPATVSPLDVRVGLKFALLSGRGFALALAADGTLPFGDEEVFAGEKSFTLHPRLLASWTRGPVGLAINAGYRLRPRTMVLWKDPATIEGEIPLLVLDDELTYNAAVVYQFHRMFGLGAEVYGVVPVMGGSRDVVSTKVEYDSTKCPAGTPAGSPCEITSSRRVDVPSPVVTEALGGLLFSPIPQLTVTLGAGAGVTGSERRATLRIFGGIAWLPGATAQVAFRDRDGDMVPDDKDQCPDEPEDKDGFQDDDGCPDLDNDGDGIPDTLDRCPNDPEDIDGFQDEDGCPDPDNDGDGICDPWVATSGKSGRYAAICTGSDKCPDEPEDKDGFQDDDGCPDNDNDGDSISDKDDKCPNEPETLNGFEDEDGCPDTAPTGVTVGKGKITIADQIRFKRASGVVAPTSYKLLDEIAKKILANPQVGKIRIDGHCDSSGSAEANMKLSQARAEAVRDYLVRKGVPAGRLQAVGYGATRPLASNDTQAGRKRNRRVEFIIIQVKEPTKL